MASRPTRPGRGPEGRLPTPVAVTAVLVLGACLGGAALLLLAEDGWAVNRANVQVWAVLMGSTGLDWLVSPEVFAMAANVALFVPVFAALALLRPTWWWVVLACALSVGVELYQGALGSRLQDPGDVLANTLGAALGVAAGMVLRRVVLRRARARASKDPPPTGRAGNHWNRGS